MSHYKDPYAPPLRPKLPCNRPPWSPSYEEYHGRPDWWVELGHKDVLHRNGIDYGAMASIKENDRYWYDPKVPDGTSMTGPYGLDSTYHRNYTIKYDQPISLKEHQRTLRENCLQYKNIIGKWTISPQHPGIAVHPLFEDVDKHDDRALGGIGPGWSHFWSPWRRGPHFFDKPMNEGCIEKGLALAKYTAWGTITATILRELGTLGGQPGKPGINMRVLATNCLKNYPAPGILSLTFGTSVCIAATYRDQDDTWNWAFASALTGLTTSTIYNFNITRGVVTFAVLFGATSFFQHMRTHLHGLQGLAVSRWHSGYFDNLTGPLNWKQLPGQDAAQTLAGQVPDRWNFIV